MVNKAVIVNVSNKLIPSRLKRLNNTSEATKLVRSFLEGRGFKSSNIIVLSEGEDDEDEIPEDPTWDGITDRMRWLTKSARSGDDLFFYYSGHGNVNGGIAPLDHSFYDEPATRVTAEDMYNNMVKNVPQGCRLTAVFDTCHAGSMLNLKYKYGSSQALKDEEPLTRTSPSSSQGQIISWAACSRRGKAHGYDFTASLMEYLEEKPKATYARALQHVINDMNASGEDAPEMSSNQRLDGSDAFFD